VACSRNRRAHAGQPTANHANINFMRFVFHWIPLERRFIDEYPPDLAFDTSSLSRTLPAWRGSRP
jgi:hypothetical protein